MLEIIKSRRSIRNFLEKPVPSDLFSSLLEAARWAPSGSNMQPWVFVAVREKDNIRKIKMFSPGLGGVPTALIILCSDGAIKESTAIMDISMAAQNVMLTAIDKGLGSCCVHSFDQKALQALLSLPSHIMPELIISLGYPAKQVKATRRHPIEEIVHWEEYGGRLNE
jgi:nitroreductase